MKSTLFEALGQGWKDIVSSARVLCLMEGSLSFVLRGWEWKAVDAICMREEERARRIE